MTKAIQSKAVARSIPHTRTPDRRGSIARKLAKIKKELAADLESPLSAADDAMLRAAALAIHRVHELEASIMCGAIPDNGDIVPLLNAAHRLLGAINKRKRSVGPDLKQYLATKQ